MAKGKQTPVDEAFLHILAVSTRLRVGASANVSPSIADMEELADKLDAASSVLSGRIHMAREALHRG